MKLLLTAGDFDPSFFFRLRFSGAVSSGAESSTFKSLSGELGDALLCDGERCIENDLLLPSGLLGEDSDPVSGSVSADSRAFLFPTVNENLFIPTATNRHFILPPMKYLLLVIKLFSARKRQLTQ